MKVYKVDRRAEIKRLFVQEGLSSKAIAKKFKNKPTHQTISNWAKEKPADGGMSWAEERLEVERQVYERMSPESQAQKILQRIHLLLSKDITKFSTKEADALVKYQRFMEKVVSKDYQIPMMYELLTKFVEFLELYYKHFLTPEFINAVKHFKNELRKKLENGI